MKLGLPKKIQNVFLKFWPGSRPEKVPESFGELQLWRPAPNVMFSPQHSLQVSPSPSGRSKTSWKGDIDVNGLTSKSLGWTVLSPSSRMSTSQNPWPPRVARFNHTSSPTCTHNSRQDREKKSPRCRARHSSLMFSGKRTASQSPDCMIGLALSSSGGPGPCHYHCPTLLNSLFIKLSSVEPCEAITVSWKSRYT